MLPLNGPIPNGCRVMERGLDTAKFLPRGGLGLIFHLASQAGTRSHAKSWATDRRDRYYLKIVREGGGSFDDIGERKDFIKIGAGGATATIEWRGLSPEFRANETLFHGGKPAPRHPLVTNGLFPVRAKRRISRPFGRGSEWAALHRGRRPTLAFRRSEAALAFLLRFGDLP